MSGFFRSMFGGPTNNVPVYTGLQIQTAVNTLPIPIVWGEAKIAPNVIWYNNFQTDNASGKGGGKGGGGGGKFGGNASTTYSCSLIMAPCEGPIDTIDQVWKNQSIDTMSSLGLSLFTGTDPQSPWSYVTSSYASQALGYEGTAYVCAANYQLGASATLDNHNFSVQGLRYGSGFGQTPYTTYVNEVYENVSLNDSSSVVNSALPFNGNVPSTGYFDADPALCIEDFLTSAQFGVGFPAAAVDATTLYTQGGSNDASYQTYCRAIGLALSPALTDQEQASSVLQRWLQLTNTAAVWSAGMLRFIPYGDTTITGNGVTFTPNVTPIYNLTDDDFKVENNEDPLQVSRTDPFEAYNVWRLEVSDRASAYNLMISESRDQNAIELVEEATGSNGMRIAPTVTAHEFCDMGVAAISGQLMLQRAVYIRNSYKFRLSWEYCLLDPMYLVTVTDGILGLASAAIRLTEIEEDENGFLQVTAEEFPLGVATATLYPTQSSEASLLNTNVATSAVNAPIIFEPPAALVGSNPQVWIAASAGSAGVADPSWGGAYVWGSIDGSTYVQVGTITAAAAMGTATAALSAFGGANPDGADTLAVNLGESGGALQSVSAPAAASGGDLCIIDGELLCYETATLTSARNYNLTGLYRGLYGTAAVAHSAGAPFALLNDAIFKYDLPAGYVGIELSIKLQSFNVFGGGAQDISTCAVYTYTASGAAYDHPIAEAMLTGTALDFGSVTTAPSGEDDFGNSFTLAVELDLDLGAA